MYIIKQINLTHKIFLIDKKYYSKVQMSKDILSKNIFGGASWLTLVFKRI